MSNPDFPSLQGYNRAYTFPGRPTSTVTQRSGSRTDFEHDPSALRSSLTVEFPSINESQLDQIVAHYRAVKGVGRFHIPSTIWQTHPATDDMVPTWDRGSPVALRYEGPPTWEMLPSGLYNARISIVSGL